MLEDLLLPLGLLVVLAVGGIWAVKISRDRRDVLARVEAMVSAGAPVQTGRADSTIRLRQERRSRFAVIERLLKVPKDVPLANVMAPTWVFVIGIIIGGTVFWFGQVLLSAPMSLVVGLVAGLFTVRSVFDWELGRYQTKLVGQLPDTVQLVVSATRAGLPVAEAFRAVAEEMQSPTKEEFTRVANEMSLGGTADEALLALHHRTGVAEYAIFAVTIGVQAKSGGRLAETIQNLAETVRERLQVTAKAKSLAGEAKLSAIIMSSLPLVSGCITALTQPQQIAILFNDPRGTRLLVIGIVTLFMGAMTMRHLINGATKD